MLHLQQPYFIFPLMCGTLSVLASAMIILVILRSEVGLKTTYHRIMFFMSCCDILGSLSVATTTLPLPSEMPGVVYDFDAPRIGNTKSCEVQVSRESSRCGKKQEDTYCFIGCWLLYPSSRYSTSRCPPAC